MVQSKFSFSIRAILIATGYMAIAVAALVSPGKTWLGIMYGITLGLLFFSLLGMIYRTDRARSYWIGFALFGFGYLAIIFGPLGNLSEKLPTTLVLHFACAQYHGPTYYTPYGYSSYPTPLYSPPTTTYIPAPVTTYTSVAPGSYVPNSYNSTTPLPSSSTDEMPSDGEEETTTETDSSSPDASSTISPTVNYSPPSYSTPVTSYPMPASPNVLIDPYTFNEIGHAVFAMMFAALGGFMAQFLFVSRQVQQAQRTKQEA